MWLSVPPAGAAFYGNESVVGKGLAEFLAAGRRGELFITSKVWNTHHKPADSRWASVGRGWQWWLAAAGLLWQFAQFVPWVC